VEEEESPYEAIKRDDDGQGYPARSEWEDEETVVTPHCSFQAVIVRSMCGVGCQREEVIEEGVRRRRRVVRRWLREGFQDSERDRDR